jgi:hypothetical protein
MSFESSMKHHNFRSEMMSYANLVQNQVMIFQQQQMVNAQNQTNAILAGNEQVRQREKQIDIWMEEFKFQGLSPIESHNQALAEWEINEIKKIGLDYVNELDFLVRNSLEILKEQISNKPMRKALLGTWSKKFVTITEDSDEVIMYEWMAEKNYKDKMIDLNNKLINLPKSKLNNDADVREVFHNAATNPSPIELLDEASKSLDSLVMQLNTLESIWRKLTVEEKDFANNKQKYSSQTIELYESIKIDFNNLDRNLREFSTNLIRLIKSTKILEVFESDIKGPLKILEEKINNFQMLVTQLSN